MKNDLRSSLAKLFGLDRKSAPRAKALRLETLETRELLSASTFQDALAIDALASAPALVAANSADALIDLSNAELDTVVVANANDSGEGSLRWAIETAPEGATIAFADNLQGQTISVNSQIEINKSIAINAADANITLDAGGSSRIFLIAGQFNASTGAAAENGKISVSISGLTFTGGNGSGTAVKGTYGTKTKAYGGAIWAQAADLELTDVVFSGNSSTKNGGAIAIGDGALTVNAGAFSGNSGLGGAIYASNASLTVDSDTTFAGNTGANGGAVMLSGGTASLDGVYTQNSAATGNGGAIYASNGAAIDSTGAVFTGNSAKQGGAIYLTGASITGTYKFIENTASSAGGAVSLNAVSSAKFVDTTFSGDSATTKGGAIAVSASTLETTGGSFDGETSKAGGAVHLQSGSATFAGTVFSGNKATSTYGGAIYALKGDVSITGGSLTKNEAKTRGGAVYIQGASSAYANLTVARVALQDNVSTSGAAIASGGYVNVSLSNSLLTGNKSTNGSAFWLTSSALSAVNATIAENTGSALYAVKTSGLVANTILAANDKDVQLSSSTIAADYTITGYVAWTGAGANNIAYDGSELFRKAFEGDYLLAKDSLAANAGSADYVVEGDVSINGVDRATSEYTSVGAYELNPDPTGEAGLVVTTDLDVVDDMDGVISLREAVANALATGGGTVSFADNLAGQTIVANETITVDGTVSVVANEDQGIALATSNGDYLFTVASGELAVKNISFPGNAIYLSGATATVENSEFSGEQIVLYAGNGAKLSVVGSNFTGGGNLIDTIRSYSSEVVLSDVTAHVAGTFLATHGGKATVVDSDIWGRQEGVSAGAAVVNVVNTKVSSPSRAVYLGFGSEAFFENVLVANGDTGINLYNSNLELRGGTIAGCNQGLVLFNSSTADLYNTIIATNREDVHSENSTVKAHNVLSNYTDWTESEKTYVYANGDLLFADAANGDYTPVRYSTAVNTGNDDYVTVKTDLNGNERIVGKSVDLGAVESEVVEEIPSLTVTILDDVVDPYDDQISLREAVAYAKSHPDLGDKITFADSLAGQTITLKEEVEVDFKLALEGDSEKGIVIKYDGEFWAFSVDRGDFTVKNVSFIGQAAQVGNSIFTVVNSTFDGGERADRANGFTANNSKVYISDSSFSNVDYGVLAHSDCVVEITNSTSNGAKYFAGATDSAMKISGAKVENAESGIVAYSSDVAIADSIVSSSKTGVYSGVDSTVAIQNSLVAGNETGVHAFSTKLTLTNVTVAGNTAAGLDVSGAEAYLYNTIVATNGADVQANESTVEAHNVLSGYSNWSDKSDKTYVYASGDVLFTDAAKGNYTLAKYAKAINRGDDKHAEGIAKDLAGNDRVQGGAVDIGAYESDVAIETPSVTVTTLDDVDDFNDGEISLREAVAYAKLLGQTKIAFKEGLIDTIALDGTITVDYDLTIAGTEDKPLKIKTEGNVYAFIVTNGELAVKNADFEGNAIAAMGKSAKATVEGSNFTGDSGRTISIQAIDGANIAVADSEFNGVAAGVIGQGAVVNVSGSTFTDSGYYGVLVKESSALTVSDSVFNGAGYSGISLSDSQGDITETTVQNARCGIEIFDSTVNVSNSVVENVMNQDDPNYTGICCYSSTVNVVDTKISGGYFGVYDAYGTATLDNVLIHGSWGGLGVFREGKAVLRNTTIANNGYDGIYNLYSTVEAYNSIVVGSGEADVFSYGGTTVGRNVLYGTTLYEGWTDGEKLYVYSDGDKLFADAAIGDYTLAKGSIAINTGNNDYVTNKDADPKDLAGKDRIQGGAVDLGAYESPYKTEAPSLTVTTLSNEVNDEDGEISLREAIAYAKSWPSLGTTITFKYGLSGTILLDSSIVIDSDLTLVGNEDGGVVIKTTGEVWAFVVANGELTVKNAEFDGYAIGISGESAKATVEKCKFTGDSNQTYSIFAKNATITVADSEFDGVKEGVRGDDAVVVVSGSTFTNSGEYGVEVMELSTLTVSNSVFNGAGSCCISINGSQGDITETTTQGAKLGIAVYESTVNVSNSVVETVLSVKESIYKGILCYSSTVNVVDTKIIGGFYGLFVDDGSSILENVLVHGSNGGIGVFNQGKAVLKNATVANNKLVGVYNESSSFEAYNSIVVMNGSRDVFCRNGTAIGHNVLSGDSSWSAGSDKTYVYSSGDVLFTDAANGDYTLAEGSIAINRGNDDYVTNKDADPKDLEGNDRIQGGAVDLGAYESPYKTEAPSLTVTTLSNEVNDEDGDLSLLSAITLAMNNPELGTTITFKDGLSGTISLDSTINISSSLTIQGNGSVTISTTDSAAFIVSGENTEFAVSNISFSGLALNVDGSVANVSDCTFADGAAPVQGAHGAKLKIENSTFTNFTRGVQVWENCELTVVDSVFEGGESAGTGIVATQSDVEVVGVKSTGGAIFLKADGGGTVKVNRSEISGCAQDGIFCEKIDNLYVSSSKITGCAQLAVRASEPTGEVELSNSLLANNGTGFGALVANSVRLVSMTIVGNDAGVALLNSNAWVYNSIIYKNGKDVWNSDSDIYGYGVLTGYDGNWIEQKKLIVVKEGTDLPIFSDSGDYTLAMSMSSYGNPEYANDYFGAIEYDLAGNPRLSVIGTIDLGAYQYQAPSDALLDAFAEYFDDEFDLEF